MSFDQAWDKLPVLGTLVDNQELQSVIRRLDQEYLARPGRKATVTTVSAAQAAQAQHDSSYRRALNETTLALPSGSAITWTASALERPLADDVAPLGLLTELCRWAEQRGYHCFFVGIRWFALQRAVSALLKQFPRLVVTGYDDLKTEGTEAVLDSVSRANPAIVFVGLPSPELECWMAEHRARLRCSVIAGVHDAFDTLARFEEPAMAWESPVLNVVDAAWSWVRNPIRRVMLAARSARRLMRVLSKELWSLRYRPHLPRTRLPRDVSTR